MDKNVSKKVLDRERGRGREAEARESDGERGGRERKLEKEDEKE